MGNKEEAKITWLGFKNEKTGEYETLYGLNPYLRYDPDGLEYDQDLFDICENL